MVQRPVELVVYCDNAAVAQPLNRFNASCTRTRSSATRGAWLHDFNVTCISDKCQIFINTTEQRADALTKALSTISNKSAKEQLRNLV
eukprot:2072145-Amphidinium_carterae.1